jgi:hypothetical protein
VSDYLRYISVAQYIVGMSDSVALLMESVEKTVTPQLRHKYDAWKDCTVIILVLLVVSMCCSGQSGRLNFVLVCLWKYSIKVRETIQ